MIYDLPGNEIYKVKPLFESLEFQCFCAAALEGIYPAKVYVDDQNNPSSAFLVTRGSWAYLAGKPDNIEFIKSLNEALFLGNLLSEGVSSLLISCTPPDWHAKLGQVFYPHEPIRMPRLHYTCIEFTYEWLSKVPKGVEILLIEKNMLENDWDELPDDVRSLILSWKGSDQNNGKGFGFVAIKNNKILSHAVVDCIVGEVGEIGLETHQDYQRRGLATVTSAAAVEYGLSQGLRQVVWDCYEHNIPSVRLADKLGFKLVNQHDMHFMIFDEFMHNYNLAWFSLEAKCYEKTIQVCESIIKDSEKTPTDIYFILACAFAGLGDSDMAFAHLNNAIERGWSSVKELQNIKEWEYLHGTREWEEVMQTISPH